MSEYIEREKLPQKKERGFFLDDNFNAGWNACLNNINSIPAADVRPVVLCKDCKHRPEKKDGRIIAPKDANGYTDYKCPFVCEDSWYNRMTADDDYCSCGEKRKES